MLILDEITNWLKPVTSMVCPLCNGLDHIVLSNRMQHKLDLTTVICSNCSFVFTNPLPPQDTYERFYVEAYEKFYKYTLTRPPSGFGQNEPAYLKARFDWIESVNP